MVARRIIGAIMLLTALAILVVSLLGAIYVGDAIRNLTTGIQSTLALTSDGLATARGSILLAQGTITDVGAALDTAVTTTSNLSTTVLETKPLLENVRTVTTQEVPENLESIQTALPSIIQVASVIDTTLTRLANFGIDQQLQLPLGVTVPLQFDLGIDYNPAVPFADSMRQLQTSLDGLPESLRALEGDLTTTVDNVGVLSDDLTATSTSLSAVNDRIAELAPMMDEYVRLIDDLTTTMADVQERVEGQLDMIATGATVLFVLLGLSQLAPLYLGFELLAGQRDPVNRVTADVAVIQAPAVTVTDEPVTTIVTDDTKPGADA